MKRSERHKNNWFGAMLKALSPQKLYERRRRVSLKSVFYYVGAGCAAVAVWMSSSECFPVTSTLEACGLREKSRSE
jgi:uncharacterized membrane protein